MTYAGLLAEVGKIGQRLPSATRQRARCAGWTPDRFTPSGR